MIQLLYNRGLETMDEAREFLNPSYDRLHSPFLFQDMEKAVARVWQAIDAGERICIYGDYDADAVTANAVLQQTFRYLGAEVVSYIPDRFTEGYGLNLEAFAKIKADGATVVITVDCGTNSVDAAEFCSAEGIDLIITDHHEITGDTPKAFALINPKNPGDVYPDHQITGVGVAYKLARGILLQKERVVNRLEVSLEEYRDWDKWLLDLVAIGTVADCHSLMGENHILVGFGLKVLAKTKWVGLRRLMDAAGVSDGLLDTHTLGFVLAPRINAAGRLEHASSALAVLMAEDPAEADALALNLDGINKRRQELTLRVVSEAREQAELLGHRKLLLLTDPEWPKGLVGLAAGRLAEEFKKPAIVLARGETECTGSARSVGNFDMVECLKSAKHLLVKFGGHKQAAGLTVATKNLDALYEQLLTFADTVLDENSSRVPLELEAELLHSDVTFPVADSIFSLGPFGIGNPKPAFMIRNAKITGMKMVGKEQQHIQITFMLGASRVSSIGFNLAAKAMLYGVGDMIDVAAELMTDTFRGIRQLKLRLIDLRLPEIPAVATRPLEGVYEKN